jgi:hypothetical protein
MNIMHTYLAETAISAETAAGGGEQIRSSVSCLQAWTAHVDRLAGSVAEMNNNLLLSNFELQSEETRRLAAMQRVQAQTRRSKYIRNPGFEILKNQLPMNSRTSSVN